MERRHDYTRRAGVDHGMVADVAYHDGGSRNPHAHVLLTTRRIGPDGFAGKDRSWNDRALLQEWRREWAASANRALQQANSPERIDHQSLVDQQQAAGVHLGRAAHQELRTGRPVERVSRALDGDSLDQPPRSGLERTSRFDRELRATVHVRVGDSSSPKSVDEVLFRKPLAGLGSDERVPRIEQDARDLSQDSPQSSPPARSIVAASRRVSLESRRGRRRTQ